MTMAGAMASHLSAISPINGVSTAPPIKLITRKDAPIFAFGPRPFTPEAKMVGYMTDIKKLVQKIAHIPIHPGNSIPIKTRQIFTIA